MIGVAEFLSQIYPPPPTRTHTIIGATGFLGSQCVALLLKRGYIVHGTVRSLKKEKVAHLKSLPGASIRLKLFKADLLVRNRMAK